MSDTTHITESVSLSVYTPGSLSASEATAMAESAALRVAAPSRDMYVVQLSFNTRYRVRLGWDQAGYVVQPVE